MKPYKKLLVDITASRSSLDKALEFANDLFNVIDALCDSAWAVNRAAQAGATEVPAMKEFFQFAWAERQYVMRKRQWP